MLEKFLIALIAILIGTKVAGHICNRIGIPSVIGELLVGILVGPALLNIVQPSDMLHVFSQIGVILLMFLAGLESDFDELKKHLKPSVTVAILGIIFPIVLTASVGAVFHLGLVSSLFLGIIFSATSVSISVQVLREYKRLDTEEGSIILGAAVVDDIVVVVLVSIFASIISLGSSITYDFSFFWNLLGLKFLFFLLVYVVAKYVLNPVLKIAGKIIATESETAVALVLCFTFAVISEKLGMSDVIGAFFMGLMLSSHKTKKVIQNRIITIGYALFIPVFFVSIGLDIQFSAFKEHAFFILILTIVGIVSKQLGGYLGSRINHVSKAQSKIVGAGMVSRGEMALIIVQMGQKFELIPSGIYSAIIVAIILTTLFSPLLIKQSIEASHKKKEVMEL